MMSIQPSKLSNDNSDSGRLENLLFSVTQISKSITSNLDLDNLINSTITLIHQNFDFEIINIFLIQSQEEKILRKFAYSNNRIIQSKEPYIETDNGSISRAINRREIVVVNDTSKEAEFGTSYFDLKEKSELVIPLISGDFLLGILDLRSSIINRFSQNDIDAFQLLSEFLALAIRNARLFKTEQLRGRISESIFDIIKNISAGSSQEEIMSDILSLIENFLPSSSCALWLVENNLDNGHEQFKLTLNITVIKIFDQFGVKNDQQIRADNKLVIDQLQQEDGSEIQSKYPWVNEVINSQEPLIGSGVVGSDPLGNALSLPNNYSVLGIPLKSDNNLLGMIIVIHNDPDLYDIESRTIASIYANYASTAINNARLFSLANDQTWMTTVIQQAIDNFHTVASMDELLEAILSMIIDIAGANACTIYLWDSSNRTFLPMISSGYNAEQKIRLDEWEVTYGSVSAFDSLIESNSPIILNNATIPDVIRTLVFPDFEFQSDQLILFPLYAQDNILGAVLIDFSNSKLESNYSQKRWDEFYDIALGITNQAAISIEKLFEIKALEEEAYISVALLQVAQAIVSLNLLEDILSTIVRITPILVGIKRCIIYLWNREALEFEPAQYYGFSKNELLSEGHALKSSEFPFIETVLLQNRIAYYPLTQETTPGLWLEIGPEEINLVENIATESSGQLTHKLDSEVLQENTRFLIGFPLSVIGEVLGVMLIEEEEPIKGPQSFHIREKRIEIINGITQQAALAIKNEQLRKGVLENERMERELQLAREIQRTFIPALLPTFDGWDMDARWQPARQVAGDFYDFLLLDGHLMGFVIADVADKGMPAALFMTLIRTLIRAAAKDNISPAVVLKQVNDLLIQDAKNGMFVTVFYGVLDISTGLFTYANAGHNPPVVKVNQSKELIELTRTSIAIGIFPDIEVEERKILLLPGDWILFYTDGVTEAFSSDQEMYGIDRLYNLLLDHPFSSMKVLLDEVDESVKVFLDGNEISDDITIAGIFRNI